MSTQTNKTGIKNYVAAGIMLFIFPEANALMETLGSLKDTQNPTVLTTSTTKSAGTPVTTNPNSTDKTTSATTVANSDATSKGTTATNQNVTSDTKFKMNLVNTTPTYFYELKNNNKTYTAYTDQGYGKNISVVVSTTEKIGTNTVYLGIPGISLLNTSTSNNIPINTTSLSEEQEITMGSPTSTDPNFGFSFTFSNFNSDRNINERVNPILFLDNKGDIYVAFQNEIVSDKQYDAFPITTQVSKGMARLPIVPVVPIAAMPKDNIRNTYVFKYIPATNSWQNTQFKAPSGIAVGNLTIYSSSSANTLFTAKYYNPNGSVSSVNYNGAW